MHLSIAVLLGEAIPFRPLIDIESRFHDYMGGLLPRGLLRRGMVAHREAEDGRHQYIFSLYMDAGEERFFQTVLPLDNIYRDMFAFIMDLVSIRLVGSMDLRVSLGEEDHNP